MADFLDFAKDIERGVTDITPDDMAPEPSENIENYDEKKDPEIVRESVELRKLNESIKDDVKQFVTSNSDLSFENFQASGLNKKGMTSEKYSEWYWYLVKLGQIQPSPNAPPKKGKKGDMYTSSGAAASSKKGGGVYDEDIYGEDDDFTISKELAGLSQSTEGIDIKGTADETFQEMQNIVKNIILMRSDKRHAAIFGDAGIGKCIFKDTLLKINIDDIITKELELYLNYKFDKEKIIEIGQLIDFIRSKYGIDFNGYDTFINVPFKLELPDENNEWRICSKFYKKQAPLYELKFKNNITLKAADDHILVDSNYKQKKIKELKPGDKFYYVEIISNELIEEKADVYSPQIESEKHLYKTANDLIHHNTFEVMETCKKYILQNPTGAQWIYEAGDIGSSMTSLVPFFYKNSQNKIIVLDDNDKMITASLSPDIMNMMKAILDPKASDEKPITVRNSMRPIFAKQLSDLEDSDEEEKEAAKKKKLKQGGHMIEIDVPRLKEGYVRITVDGEDIVNRPGTIYECTTLLENIRPLREDKEPEYFNRFKPNIQYYQGKLNEAKTNGDWLADLVGDDDEKNEDNFAEKAAQGITEDGGEEGSSSFPRRFLFNSSVIFISNLSLDQINTAVLDRCETVEIKLSLQQFLDRLGRIYGGLCKGQQYSIVSQELRDWAKKCTYTVLGIAIEAFKTRTPVFGQLVEINRKLTFRMFDEFVVAWLRYSMDRAERVDGKDLEDKSYRDKLSKELVPEILRRKVIPWLKQTTRAN